MYKRVTLMCATYDQMGHFNVGPPYNYISSNEKIKNIPNSMHFDEFRLEFNHIFLQFESSNFNFVTISALSTVSS